MKVLVTGANGFLGTALVRRLLTEGHTCVRAFVRPGSQRARLEELRQEFPDGALEMYEGTLTSAARIAPALEGIEVVYHLAAGMSGAPADLFQSTVVGSKHLLQAIAQHWPRPTVVLVSSMAVYGTAYLRPGHVVDEFTPLEEQPRQRDAYAQSKLRQEQLFWEYRTAYSFPLVVLRPGVLYGPGGPALSRRIGLPLGPLFLHLGGRNLLPLSFVDNCADAIALAGRCPAAVGQAFNVHDDELITCRNYLKRYKKEVEHLRVLSLPYALTRILAGWVERYHIHSHGQLPAFLTPYKSACAWKSTRFSNAKLKDLGWRQHIPTEVGLRLTFKFLRAQRQPAVPVTPPVPARSAAKRAYRP